MIVPLTPAIMKTRGVDELEIIHFLEELDYRVLNVDGSQFDYKSQKLPKICDLLALPN